MGNSTPQSSICRRAIDLDRNVAMVYLQLAELLRKQGRFTEAVEVDGQRINAGRRLAEKLNQRGIELVQAGKSQEAMGQFQTAIAADPASAPAHANLADVLAAQGYLNEALAEYRQALLIDPALERARQGLRQLAP